MRNLYAPNTANYPRLKVGSELVAVKNLYKLQHKLGTKLL